MKTTSKIILAAAIIFNFQLLNFNFAYAQDARITLCETQSATMTEDARITLCETQSATMTEDARITLCETQSATMTQSTTMTQRTNIGLSLNTLTSTNFVFGSGFLKGHPERCVDLTATVNLWRHVEVGAVLSLQGTSPTGYSGVAHFATAPNVDYYYLGWDDSRYHLSGGVIIQLHLNNFEKRYLRENRFDLVARGGWGLGGQVDGFWVGFGEEFRITRQLIWSISADYGNFPFATLKQVADNETGWRFTVGLKCSLR